MTLRIAQQTQSSLDPFQRQERARIENTLSQVGIFRDLPAAAIHEIAQQVTVSRTPGGTAVFAQNDGATGLYILMAGRVKVVRFGENGREVTLSLLRTGDVFGEMALFEEAVRSANVVAIEPATTLCLSREDLMSHLVSYPQTSIALLGEMSRRLRRAGETIAELALCDVQDRLIRRLVLLAQEDATRDQRGLVIRRRPTQQDLANMVGSCRETISRTFNHLARKGLIVTSGRSLIVTNELVGRVEEATRQAA